MKTRTFAIAATLVACLAAPAAAQPKSIKKLKLAPDASAEVRKAVDGLRDGNMNRRAAAVKRLGELGAEAKPALPFVVEMAREEGNVVVEGKDTTFIGIVAEALKAIDGPAAVPPLVAMLDDKSARGNAAAALGVLRDARAVDPLVALLSGKDQQGRYWAVFALGLIKDPRAVDPLAAVLRDEDAHGNVAVAVLLHTNAVEALGEIKDKRAVPPLSSYLGTGKYPKARAAAAEALGKIGDASGVPALVTVIGNDTAFGVDDVELAREIQQNAVQALGAIKDPQAVDPLLQYMKAGKHPAARAHAAKALGQVGDRRAVDPLIAAMGDTSADLLLRFGAALGLEILEDMRAVEPMIVVLEGPEERLRVVAARFLKQMTGQDLGNEGTAWRKWWVASNTKTPTPAAKPKPKPKPKKPS